MSVNRGGPLLRTLNDPLLLIESGRFYPASAGNAEVRLSYYTSQFPIAEVDSTYYGMPDERMVVV